MQLIAADVPYVRINAGWNIRQGHAGVCESIHGSLLRQAFLTPPDSTLHGWHHSQPCLTVFRQRG